MKRANTIALSGYSRVPARAAVGVQDLIMGFSPLLSYWTKPEMSNPPQRLGLSNGLHFEDMDRAFVSETVGSQGR